MRWLPLASLLTDEETGSERGSTSLKFKLNVLAWKANPGLPGLVIPVPSLPTFLGHLR